MEVVEVALLSPEESFGRLGVLARSRLNVTGPGLMLRASWKATSLGPLSQERRNVAAIHRDVKAGNVHMTRNESGDITKLAVGDFDTSLRVGASTAHLPHTYRDQVVHWPNGK